MQVSRNWQRIALPGRIYGFEVSAPLRSAQSRGPPDLVRPVTCLCPCGVTASTSAFQADDPGSIPGTGFAGEWNGIPFQPHTLEIAGSTPVPATIAEWLDGEAPPSYGVTCRFESGFCNGCPMRTLFIQRKIRYVITVSEKLMKCLRKRRNATMLYVMICKQHRHEEERFWFCQERRFVMPVLEKQILHLSEMSRLNI